MTRQLPTYRGEIGDVVNHPNFVMIRSAMAQRATGTTDPTDDTHLIPELTPLSNQLDEGSCVCNALADSAEMILGLEGNTVVQLSRQFLYWTTRAKSYNDDKDSGTTLSIATTQVKTIGICPESVWPYDPSKMFVAPSLECYQMASDNKIDGYYNVTSNDNQRLDDLELAVRANHPPIFGTQLGQAFMDYQGGGGVLSPPTDNVGRHAMIWTGVRTRAGRRQFLARNSWGSWGDAGHVWMDQSYITWSQTQDIWIGTRMLPVMV